MTSLFDLLLLGLGIYVLVAGITEKGKLYAADNVKEGMEEKFKSAMRKVYLALGIVMLLNGIASMLMSLLYEPKTLQEATETAAAVFEMVPKFDLGAWSFLTYKLLTTLTYIFMGFVVALIVVMIIVLRKLTERKAAPAGSAQNSRQAGHILPVDAFDFDEEEPAPEKSAEMEDKVEA